MGLKVPPLRGLLTLVPAQYWVISPLAEEGEEDNGLLIIPSSLDCSDWRFNATAQGFSSGEDFYRHLVSWSRPRRCALSCSAPPTACSVLERRLHAQKAYATLYLQVDTFDTLYAEGEQGQPKLMSISLHPRIIGRAGRLHYLRR